jgi:hypothetical protein
MSQSVPRDVDAYVVEWTKCRIIHALRHALDVHSPLRLLPGLLRRPFCKFLCHLNYPSLARLSLHQLYMYVCIPENALIVNEAKSGCVDQYFWHDLTFILFSRSLVITTSHQRSSIMTRAQRQVAQDDEDLYSYFSKSVFAVQAHADR